MILQEPTIRHNAPVLPAGMPLGCGTGDAEPCITLRCTFIRLQTPPYSHSLLQRVEENTTIGVKVAMFLQDAVSCGQMALFHLRH